MPTVVPNSERKAGEVLPISNMTRLSSSMVRPRPPKLSGMVRPNSPISFMSLTMSSGISSVSATISSAGTSLSRTKRLTESSSVFMVS